MKELLQRCRSGDEQAIATLIRRYEDRAVDFAAAFLHDEHLAQDAVESLVEMHPEEARREFRRLLARELLAISVQVLAQRAVGKGRLAAYGLLVPDEASRVAIREGKDLASLPVPKDSLTLADEIDRRAAQGLITAEAAQEAKTQL